MAKRKFRPSTGRGARAARAQSKLDARRRLKREIVKMRLRVLTRFPKARGNVAERQRSRSEADTVFAPGRAELEAGIWAELLFVLWAESE